MKRSLESVRQISRQKPAQASVVRQPKKVYCEMIRMCEVDHHSESCNGGFLL
jgi:hypothetical protein